MRHLTEIIMVIASTVACSSDESNQAASSPNDASTDVGTRPHYEASAQAPDSRSPRPAHDASKPPTGKDASPSADASNEASLADRVGTDNRTDPEGTGDWTPSDDDPTKRDSSWTASNIRRSTRPRPATAATVSHTSCPTSRTFGSDGRSISRRRRTSSSGSTKSHSMTKG